MLEVGKMDLTTVDIWQVLVDRLIDDGEVALVVIIHFLFLTLSKLVMLEHLLGLPGVNPRWYLEGLAIVQQMIVVHGWLLVC